MRYIVIDQEATCWENVRSPDMEGIEIGAVALTGPSGPVIGESGAFICPVAQSGLSEFSTTLTSIRQEE